MNNMKKKAPKIKTKPVTGTDRPTAAAEQPGITGHNEKASGQTDTDSQTEPPVSYRTPVTGRTDGRAQSHIPVINGGKKITNYRETLR